MATAHLTTAQKLQTWLEESEGSGVLREQEQLPTQTQLAKELDVSTNTLSHTLALLEIKGVVESIGRSYYLRSAPSQFRSVDQVRLALIRAARTAVAQPASPFPTTRALCEAYGLTYVACYNFIAKPLANEALIARVSDRPDKGFCFTPHCKDIAATLERTFQFTRHSYEELAIRLLESLLAHFHDAPAILTDWEAGSSTKNQKFLVGAVLEKFGVVRPRNKSQRKLLVGSSSAAEFAAAATSCYAWLNRRCKVTSRDVAHVMALAD